MYMKTKLLRLTIILCVALFFTLATAPASIEKTRALNGTTVTKIKVNGRNADVILIDDDTDTLGFLNAAEDQTTNTMTLDFSYRTAHPTDPDFVIIFQGAGEIRNAALTITSTFAHLSLTTPTSYFVNRCIFNIINGEFTCAPGDPLTFDLIWVRVGVRTFFEQRNILETFGPFITRFQGQFTSYPAAVNGTFSGTLGQITATDLSGNLRDSQGKTFIREITMNANP